MRYETQIKEIKRMIQYLFLDTLDSRPAGLMPWGGEKNKFLLGWNDSIKGLMPFPTDPEGNKLYGHINYIVLDLDTLLVEYTFEHSFDIAQNQYLFLKLTEQPKILQAVYDHLLKNVEVKAEKIALQKIKDAEIERVLTGKYERLEHWK